MKKLILMGRVAAGKTTLTQALKGEQLHYCKTQYIRYTDTIIDTPGEYTEVASLGAALALYAYEADVVGLVVSANEPFTIFPPCITCLVNREVIGIITGVDKEDANTEQVTRWLQLSGCETIFYVSSYTGQGLSDIIDYLREEDDPPEMPVPSGDGESAENAGAPARSAVNQSPKQTKKGPARKKAPKKPSGDIGSTDGGADGSNAGGKA